MGTIWVIFGRIGSILGQKSTLPNCIKYGIVLCAYCVFNANFTVLNVSEVRMTHPCIYTCTVYSRMYPILSEGLREGGQNRICHTIYTSYIYMQCTAVCKVSPSKHHVCYFRGGQYRIYYLRSVKTACTDISRGGQLSNCLKMFFFRCKSCFSNMTRCFMKFEAKRTPPVVRAEYQVISWH